MSDRSVRVGAIEDKLRYADDEIRDMLRSAAALRNAVVAAEQYPVPNPPQRCTTTVYGRITSACAPASFIQVGIGLAGVTVILTAQPSGIETTLVTEADGYFSYDVPKMVSDTTFDLDVPSPPARYAALSLPGAISAVCDVERFIVGQLAPDTGYECVPWCVTPAKLPLIITDTFFGTMAEYIDFTVFNFGGSATCPIPANHVIVAVSFTGSIGSPGMNIAYSGSGAFPHCPGNGLGQLDINNLFATTPSGATSCPVGLNQTFTWTSAVFGASGTTTVQESP